MRFLLKILFHTSITFMVFLLYSCKKKESLIYIHNKRGDFILSEYQKSKSKNTSIFKKNHLKNQGIYGLYNIIIYNDSVIYFYEDKGRFIPDINKEASLVTYNDGKLFYISDSTKYPYLYLIPSKLKLIKPEEIELFLNERIKHLPSLKRDNTGYKTIISISLFKDTLNNKNFNTI